MQKLWLILIVTSIILACGGSYTYVPPPETFTKADLVGTWQAKYGFTDIDTITLKADGTYQQRFQAARPNYFYESPWNKWYVRRSPSGKLKLYLEGMRYYASTFELGESGGRNSRGDPILFYDIDEDDVIEMTDKVILRIKGNKYYPRGIVLWHMHTDPDASPPYFVLVDDQ